jgi:hypothetical protein
LEAVTYFCLYKKNTAAGLQRLTPIILAAWEAEIRRITVQGQPGQTVYKTKITRQKWTGSVACFTRHTTGSNPSPATKKKKLKLMW